MKDSGVPLCDSMRQFSYTGPFAQKLLIRRCRLSSICIGMCIFQPMMSMLRGPSSAISDHHKAQQGQCVTGREDCELCL